MRSLFFPKLAFQNIGKNKRFYLPYMITCIFTISMFYDLLFIVNNKGIMDIHGGDILKQMLFLGVWIVGIFSFIFLFYTNSFLLKHRKKELGLYNILGMSKMNIAHVLFWETIITAVITLAIGLGFGVIVSKLMLLLLCKILHFDVQLGFSISPASIEFTLVMFAVIFAVTLLYNWGCIRVSKPVELLHGGNVGEKEPKAKWFMALLGIIFLGVAYYIALTCKDPVAAIPLFFIAVLLVIFGTYMLFISGSIAILKILRNNKSYYYKSNHFTSVSGMIYRMKQNAAGLASICILSTMVLVMVSGTVCLNVGTDDIFKKRCNYDITITTNTETEPKTDLSKMTEVINHGVENSGRISKDMRELSYLEVAVARDKNALKFFRYKEYYEGTQCVLSIISDKQYNEITGKNVNLKDNDMLAKFVDIKDRFDEISIEDKDYNVEWIDEYPMPDKITAYSMTDVLCLVVNESQLDSINKSQKEISGDAASSVKCEFAFNTDGTDQQKINCYEDVTKAIENETEFNYSGDSKQYLIKEFYGLYGGLFFIGIFLGFMFVGFTTLIIYYKQISEGYDDKQRFEIMQKVGMSKSEVKKSINSQVLKVFFLPLAMAVVHLAFAFKIITRLLLLLGFTNTPLFVGCVIGTVVVFAVVYFLIYYFTAKTYFKIVNS